MGGQASLMIKQLFVGWRDLLQMLRQEKMHEELLRLKWKRGESLKKAMTAMFGGQSSLLLKNALSGWRDLLASLRQERIMEQLKEENLRLKGKSDESMKRAMSMMMGGQASLMIKQLFVGWRDLLQMLRQEKMHEELLRLKWKSGESLKKAMTAMFG